MSEYMAFPATLALLALTVLTSLTGFRSAVFNNQNILWVGPVLQKGEWYRLVSSGFLHVNSLHLLLNMYGLWLFGRVVEHALGGAQLLVIYLVSLAGGSAWAVIWNRENPDYKAAGASGAISGVILAFCLIDPFSILLLFFILPVWGIVFAAGYILISWTLSHRAGRIIGHEAHLGGALAGAGTALLVQPGLWGHFTGLIAERMG